MTGHAMTDSAVSVRRLSFTYPARDEPTLDGVSLDVPAGCWTVLSGATGSGKTTLLKIIAGLIGPDTAGRLAGDVTLCGQSVATLSRTQVADRLGFVGQSADDQICSTTVTAELAFGLENLALDVEEISRRIGATLDEFSLGELAGQTTHSLSGGQKQRLVLAAVMAMRPRVLLLDEPLAQLDAVAAAELLELLARLRDNGTTIIMAEHRLEALGGYVDRVFALRDGALVNGEPTNLDWVGAQRDDTLSELPKTPSPNPLCEDGGGGLRGANLAKKWSLRADDIAFAYPGGGRVWEDVSLTLAPGESVAVLGPNGSGKSTLLGVLAGLHAPLAGSVTVDRAGDARADERFVRGLLLQNPDLMLFSRTVRDELAFGPRCAGCLPVDVAECVAEVSEQLRVADLLDEDPMVLSRGQRMRVALAAVVAMRPQLLLLDEPTTGQDVAQVEGLMRLLARREQLADVGRCLVFSTHDVRLAGRFASRVIILAEGRVQADGPAAEVLGDEALLRAARLLADVDPRRNVGLDAAARRTLER